jgi:hypothetical protein
MRDALSVGKAAAYALAGADTQCANQNFSLEVLHATIYGQLFRFADERMA